MHLMYSAALTKPTAAQLDRLVHVVYGKPHVSRDLTNFTDGSVPTRGSGRFTFLQPTASVAPVLDDFLSSKYSISEAVKSMQGIMMHPERVDQRENHISLFKPSHRLAFMSHQQHGILLPFASSTADFTEPNRYDLNVVFLFFADELSQALCILRQAIGVSWTAPCFRRLGYGCCFSNWASLRRQLYGSLWLSILLHQVASTRVCSTHAAISYPYLCNSTNRLRFIWLPLKQQSVVILENSCQV